MAKNIKGLLSWINKSKKQTAHAQQAQKPKLDDQSLLKLFNQFAGKTVRAEMKTLGFGADMGDQDVLFPDRKDPTYKVMEKLAKDNGRQDFFLLSADWEGKSLPHGLKDVVCGYIEPVSKGKWRVKDKFVIG